MNFYLHPSCWEAVWYEYRASSNEKETSSQVQIWPLTLMSSSALILHIPPLPWCISTWCIITVFSDKLMKHDYSNLLLLIISSITLKPLLYICFSLSSLNTDAWNCKQLSGQGFTRIIYSSSSSPSQFFQGKNSVTPTALLLIYTRKYILLSTQGSETKPILGVFFSYIPAQYNSVLSCTAAMLM